MSSIGITSHKDGVLGPDERQTLAKEPTTNATFYTFKNSPSRKWGYSGRGVLPKEAFDVHSMQERRDVILRHNGDLVPGMSTRAEDMYLVVIADESVAYGWPLMFPPREG